MANLSEWLKGNELSVLECWQFIKSELPAVFCISPVSTAPFDKAVFLIKLFMLGYSIERSSRNTLQVLFYIRWYTN